MERSGLRYSSNHYARTYYLLFQLAVTRRATLEKARHYIKLAWDCRKLFLGEGVECDDLNKFASYVCAPERHQAYLAGEP